MSTPPFHLSKVDCFYNISKEITSEDAIDPRVKENSFPSCKQPRIAFLCPGQEQ